jgi:hypothetical protein
VFVVEAAALSTNGQREGAVVLRHTVTRDFLGARESQKTQDEKASEEKQIRQKNCLKVGYWCGPC